MVKTDKIHLRDEETAAGKKAADNSAYSSEEDVFAALVANEEGHDIKYRTLTWQKATLLLFGEYVCLAILALPWSFSVLGWVTGLFVQIGMGMIAWYTSYVLWQWCMKNPEIRDICDIAAHLFPGRFAWVAYELTSVMLLLNNIFIIGFHIFTGAKILNVLSDDSMCTVAFQAFVTIIGIICSVPRTLQHVSHMSVVSAVVMGVAILCTLVFVGIQDHPLRGYGGVFPELGQVRTFARFPDPDLSFVDGLNAVLNITFLWIGQILYPSFIAEMKEPRDFPKALAALTVLEMILFLVVAVVGYNFLGQYARAPMFESLLDITHRKVTFGLAIVPTVLIAVIYSNVTCKFVYRRIFGNSRHSYSHTVVGWSTWIAVVIAIWAFGFVLGNVIPSMGHFLSIMSSAFDSAFGFIYWAVAYYHLNRGKFWKGPWRIFQSILNIVLFALGLFMLGPGLYAAVDAIVLDYASAVRHPFSCVSNA